MNEFNEKCIRSIFNKTKNNLISMRITLLMFYLYSGFTFGQSKPNTFFVPASKAPPADSLIDILVNIEELIWQDSTKVVFLAITHHDDKYDCH